MSYETTYIPEFGLAGLEDSKSKIRVFTLPMEPDEKKASIMAYSGARYSRSIESIINILKEVFSKYGGAGAAKRIENIVHGYGHASVADMSHNMIYVENVPMVTAMRFFYLNYKQDGQERSTRFQNFSSPNFYPCSDEKISGRYDELLHSQIIAYNDLLDETTSTFEKYFEVDVNDETQRGALNARSFDTLRHLLPMGMRTNFCAIMSSRDWARYISLMRGSSQHVENTLGQMLFDLLVGTDDLSNLGYVPESDKLIKYADANSTVENTVEKLKSILSPKLEGYLSEFNIGNRGVYGINHFNPVNAFIEHLALLISNESFSIENELSVEQNREHSEMIGEIGAYISGVHNDRNQLGPIFQSGTIQISGTLDIGAMKDFNRHRSLEKFIPFLDNGISQKALLGDTNNYKLCDYLNTTPMIKLRDRYDKHFCSLYRNIHNLVKEENVSVEDLRYLLPHAHLTPYRIYGSLDDLSYVQNLRLRPGGHINYRMETRNWCNYMLQSTIPYLYSLWKPFSENLPFPNPLDRGQFLDRS